MRRILFILTGLVTIAVSAVELNGKKEYIALTWKNTMAHPAFTVSFKVRMDKKNMVIPAHVKNRGRVLFHLNSVPGNVIGLRSMKIMFVMTAHPTGGYAGIEAMSNDVKGKPEKIRYNVFWRAANSQVPTDEFVTVTLVYGDGRLDAYLNQQNHATLHKPMFHSVGYAAPEYRMSFGGINGRYSTPCRVKDIAVYDRCLSDQEVKKLAAGTLSYGQIPGLLAFYPMTDNAIPRKMSPQITVKLNKKK